MTESAKTIAFVVVGAIALTAAYFIDRPATALNVQGQVGESFTRDFEVNAPKQLKVVKFDPQTAEPRQFDVAAVDGVWRIPSKDNYPADAARQMASAANALIDKKILRVAAESADAHQELGVIDPLSPKLDANSTGVGTRVTMKDADGADLVDIIVGNKVKDAEGQRYARRANQDVVYVVEVNPDNLSTSFSDWIESDLLKLSPFDIRRVFINDYSADLGFGMTPDGRIAPHVSWDRRNEFTLGYDSKDSKWNLADFEKYDKPKKAMVPDKMAADEEVNQEALNELRTALDDLLIVDVARKPAGLSSDLKTGADFLGQSNKETFQDLIAKGFSPVPLKAGAEPELLSSEGEVICTLRDGVEYVLRFGQLQVQTESAAEGGKGEPASAGGDAAAKAAGETAAGDKDKKPGDPKKDNDAKNLRRYLFVMARFNEGIIEKPQLKELPPAPGESASAGGEARKTPAPGEGAAAPVEAPKTPATPAAAPPAGGDEPAAADKPEPTDETSPDKPKADAPKAEEPKVDAPKPDEAKKDEPKPAEPKSADAKPAGEPAPAAGEAPKADAPQDGAAAKATAERMAIEQENQRAQDEYNHTVEGGKKKVAELNERFGDWYYVISNDVYKKIHLDRATLITKKKPAAAAGEPASAGGAPNPLSGLPNFAPGPAKTPSPGAAAAPTKSGDNQ